MAGNARATELKDAGNKALQENDLEKAIKLYTEAILIEPNNHVLYSNRSAAYLKKGDYNNAYLDAKKTTEVQPNWGKGYGRLGAALEYLGKDTEAYEAYEQGLKYEPDNAQLKTSLDSLERKMAQSNNPFADPNLEMKLAMDPRTREFIKDPSFMMMLNLLKQDPNNLSMCAKDPRMMTVLSVLLGINMDFPKKDEAQTSKQEEKKTPAKSSTDKASPTVPKDERKDNQKQADEEKELGNAAYKKRDFQTAHIHYDKAIELDPTNIMYLTNKAAVLFEEERLDECIQLCLKAVEVGRENRADFQKIAKPLARIGSAYFKQKKYDKALDYFNKALAEHRSDDVVQKVRQIEKLIKEEEKKAYLDPVKADAAREEGNAKFKAGAFADAVRCYEESIKRNPDDPRTYSNRAACYTKLAEFGLALKDVDKCIELDPKFVKAYLRKGSIFLMMKESAKAASAYEAALELDPNSQEARDGLMNCREQRMNKNPEERRKEALNDPEVQRILSDPAMQIILEQMQSNPNAAREHLMNPAIRDKILRLMESGILEMR